MNTEYGKRLAAARRHAGMTQMQASKTTGIPQSTISTAERLGNKSMDTVRYASAYGVSPGWLDSGDGEMVTPPTPTFVGYKPSFEALEIAFSIDGITDEATKNAAIHDAMRAIQKVLREPPPTHTPTEAPTRAKQSS